MDRKAKRALAIGGLAVGGYLLYRMSRAKSMPATQPGQRLGYLAFGDVQSDVVEASFELEALRKQYDQLFAQLPPEIQVINPSRWNQFVEQINAVYRDFAVTGLQDYNAGKLDSALQRYTNGINTLKNYRIPELKLFLESAPAAVAQYKADMAAAKTAAEQKAAQEAARKASMVDINVAYGTQASEAKKAGARADTVAAVADAAAKPLKAVGSVYGITGEKGFFGSMGEMINRFKWYAILAGGVYVAIKFGPSILRWVQSGQDKPAPAPVPPARQEV